MVHAEGPFGTLDAQGFAVTDRGAVIQFPGPGRLLLNAAQNHPQPDHGQPDRGDPVDARRP
jgi:lipopolysaccharide export system protein LptC